MHPTAIYSTALPPQAHRLSATIAYASDSDLFRGAKSQQAIQRINHRIREISGHTLAVEPLSAAPQEKLELIEIRIIGLDCKAYSFGVYGVLSRIDGVERATASFHESLAVA